MNTLDNDWSDTPGHPWNKHLFNVLGTKPNLSPRIFKASNYEGGCLEFFSFVVETQEEVFKKYSRCTFSLQQYNCAEYYKYQPFSIPVRERVIPTSSPHHNLQLFPIDPILRAATELFGLPTYFLLEKPGNQIRHQPKVLCIDAFGWEIRARIDTTKEACLYLYTTISVLDNLLIPLSDPTGIQKASKLLLEKIKAWYPCFWSREEIQKFYPNHFHLIKQ